MRWDLEIIKGLVPVCQKCREVNGEEPDKCGRLAWCKAIFSAGAAYEREECAKMLDVRANSEQRRALAHADSNSPVEMAVVVGPERFATLKQNEAVGILARSSACREAAATIRARGKP